MAVYPERVSQTWEPEAYGVMPLPSGRLVRGRGLRIDNPYEPDPEFGERVVAVVEPRPGTDAGALSEKLVQLCRERLAHFKAPRRVVVAGRLPRRPNGKLNTDGVRALVRSGQEDT